jgi:NTE family protein
MQRHDERVAVVLAGGGARGAYEAGALSVLLPELEKRGQRPQLVIGTSVGALNASFLAANAQLPSTELARRALAVWESVRWGEVIEPLISPSSLLRLAQYAGEVLGVPQARVESLLDPEPLRTSLREQVDFDQLQRNVETGVVEMAGVVATSALTDRSVVFHAGLSSPPRDERRGIDYVATALQEEHVLASSAIPAVFPAVNVATPTRARGWYFDGGSRLNTPIKPALEFGAARVVVIALGSLAPGPKQLAGESRPDALVGAGQILSGLLDDQLKADLQTLVTINGLTRATRVVPGRKRRVPYIVIAPRTRNTIARCALDVLREHYRSPLQALRSPDIALLARFVAGDADVQHAELLSFLLFAPEFTRRLIRIGQADARRWVRQRHDLDDLWQLGPL